MLYSALGVFVLSIAVTLLFWTFLPADFQQSESSDYPAFYEPVARNILKGGGFFLPDGAPALAYPPGYPILLAGIFGLAKIFVWPESLVYSAFVVLCMGFSSLLIFLLSGKIWGARAGWLSALLFLTYPFALWLTKQPNSEIPFMVAFYASIYLFWLGLKSQKRSWLFLVVSGMLAGIAMLIRPIAIGMGIILFGQFLVLYKRPLVLRFFLGLLLVFGNLLAVLPWQIWAYGQTGQVVFISTGSVNSIRDGLTFAVESKYYRQKINIPEDVTNLQKELVAEEDSMNSLAGIARTITNHFAETPLAVVELFLIKAARSWYGTDSARMEAWILVIQLAYGVLILLSSFAVWRKRSELNDLFLLVWGFVFYFWLMTIMVLSILRYMIPVIGLLFILTPGLIHILAHRVPFFLRTHV
jgi:4-amino-4-deoxy-L-arabinose transferase-like glycosyltransferase